MDEANANLSQTLLRPNSGPFILNGPVLMVNVLARQAAIAAVKLQLKRQGHRASQYPHRELIGQAETYLDANRAQLIAETRQRIMTSPGLRQMWEKAKAKYERQFAVQAKREGKRGSPVGQRTTKNPTVHPGPVGSNEHVIASRCANH